MTGMKHGVERIRRWSYDMCETWCRKNKKMVI